MFIIQYIILIIILIYLIFFAYIKINYPFWNNQPVLHPYDFWRFFYKESFVIYKYRPIKTKFCKFHQIKTISYLETSEEQNKEVLYFLQSNYISNDRILLMMEKNDLNRIYTGHNEACYISLYYDIPKYINDMSFSETELLIQKKIIGCVFSNPINVYYQNSLEDNVYTKTKFYFIDYLCISKQEEQKSKSRELLQTHEYNQRINNPSIICSLIKKEIILFEGIIPLVEYKTIFYYLRDLKFYSLPHHFYIINIEQENINILIDFLYIQTHLDLKKREHYLKFLSITELSNYLELIKQNTYYVFCLKNGEHIYGIYFFKDAKMQYEDLEGNTLQFYGSINNSDSNSLFYLGFLHSIQKIIKKFPNFKIMMFENLGDNSIIHEEWRKKNTPIFENKTAYYTFNWVYPSSPIPSKYCLIL
jgi:hypothetical protein